LSRPGRRFIRPIRKPAIARGWWISPSCCCAHELWLNKPHILQHYRERFTNILVDEFQDTNNIQYAWIRLLAGDTGKVMIVGDDDQSIYGWRGAQVENIQRFLNDFPGAETIRLEQNYRSTSNILSAANALIENNSGRLGKNCGPTAPTASRFRSTARLTILMRRALSSTASKPGRKTAGRWSSARFSIAATPSRACWKRRCCRPACRIVFMAACASSNARRSKMRSPICA
jgi:DNA helicase-2/ATP-dependent DNA helicase PcrA